jgi:hypothetical protein
MKWILLFSLFSINLMAVTCPDLNSCLENISKMTNKKYIFAEKIKGSIETSSNYQLTNENADVFLSHILQLNGYSRVPTEDKDTFLIVSSRDIRYYALNSYTADKIKTPTFPMTSDYSQLFYSFKNSSYGQPRFVANSLRPFMSRYARIIEMKNSVVIHELNTHMAMALEFARMNDRELTKEEIKKYEENEKFRREERKEEIKHKFQKENELKTEKK